MTENTTASGAAEAGLHALADRIEEAQGRAICISVESANYLRKALAASAPVAPTDEDRALDLLATMFDAYENGVQCYEDPEDLTGYLGHAFQLDNETFHACADLLNRRRPVKSPEAAPVAPTLPKGWREVLIEARNGLEDSTPSSYDNAGYRAFAGSVLDSIQDELSALETEAAPVAPAPQPAINPRTQYLTVVYQGVEAGDEARLIYEHPKVSAASWSHALDDRDAALAAAPKAAPAINKVSDIIDAYGMTPGQPERVADIPGLAEALEAAFADGSAQVTGATPGEYLPLPQPDTHCFDDDGQVDVWSYSASQMHAAIDADRAARGAAQAAPAPVTDGAVKALHDAMADCRKNGITIDASVMGFFCNRLNEQPAPASGEPAAYRLKDDEATKHYGKDVYVYYTPNEFKTPAAFKYLEPLYTAPPAQEAREPLSAEQQWCIAEAHAVAACEEYFNARPQIDYIANRRIFEAGFSKGYGITAKEPT